MHSYEQSYEVDKNVTVITLIIFKLNKLACLWEYANNDYECEFA